MEKLIYDKTLFDKLQLLIERSVSNDKYIDETEGMDKNLKNTAKFVAELMMNYGDHLGSAGAEEFYWYKRPQEKVQFFEQWFTKFLQKVEAHQKKKETENVAK